MGGLGNQMFQYAAGRAIAIKNSTPLKLDITWFNNPEARHYLLDLFAIKAEIATEKEIASFRGEKNELLTKKIGRIVSNTLFNRTYTEKDFSYDKNLLLCGSNTYIKGYFQSHNYFSAIEPLLKKEFSLVRPIASIHHETVKKITDNNSVSLHIRRGDYANNKVTSAYHGNLGTQYYTLAADMIAKKTVAEPHFFIFSDDLDWVKKNLSLDYPTTFIEGGSEINCHEEMHLMSLCSHNIIANSTFSWWGAWLNNNADKVVIAPKNWFAQPENNNKTGDLVPESWIRI